MSDTYKSVKDLLKGFSTDKRKFPGLSNRLRNSRNIESQGILFDIDTGTFKQMKWENVFFRFFDLEKNRFITYQNFESVFQLIRDNNGDNSREYRIVSDKVSMVWSAINNGKPNKSKLGLEEWNEIWRNFNPQRLSIWQWEFLKYMFFLFDSAGDKLIDLEEYTQVLQIFGVEPINAASSFRIFTSARNRSSENVASIDYGEFVKLWLDYFASGDKKSPGNYLFGPLVINE